MSLGDWFKKVLHVGPERHEPDPVKDRLTTRQEGIADRLAKMRGTTRDEVLAEAYRRADRIIAAKRQ